ncbi:pectinesterase family protein [Paenibacillus yanchengensis]|uniref:Pectinesterase n=1 Tax=Paenibacillus yanchengensis TaxID=2035833 RepID=A0ABW4YH00_9BACL
MRTWVVDQQGSGDFVTIAEAIAAVPDQSADISLIEVRNGEYREKINVSELKRNIRLVGESRDQTIIIYDDSVSRRKPDGNMMTMYETATFTVLANDFTAERITFANDASRIQSQGQAIALEAAGDRLIFRDVAVLGHQDALYTPGHGRQLYDRCYIEGTVDFIFGSATAVFDHCVIHSLDRHNGYVTAASTAEDQPYGYVFLNCRLTTDAPTATVYLGRPWRPHGSAIFVQCWIDHHIRPVGWDNWRDPDREKTARYAEYGCSGPGSDKSERAPWAKELTAEQVAAMTVSNILRGDDQWQPEL